MIDSFPYDSWYSGEELNRNITEFWTFSAGTTGTYVLTVLGILLMLAAFVGFVWLEHRKLTAQATLLRSSGAFPAPGGVPPGPSPAQPPMAGPSTHPGE